MREVTEDTIINGWKFEKGGIVMMPLRMPLQDPKIYGERIDEFIPDRFLEDLIKTDASDDNGLVEKRGPSVKSMKPFGGGVTLCPGRYFAQNANLTFIATVLRKFDIQLVGGQKEAKPLTSYPVNGAYPPDHDVSVSIRLRK
jgi:cytochrome P450